MKQDDITTPLSALQTGQKGIIVKVQGHGAFRRRITEMGFVKGQIITVIKCAPMMDPVEYQIMGYKVALRHAEADHVEVSVLEENISDADKAKEEKTPENAESKTPDVTFSHYHHNRFYHEATHTINVALVGNPNCGKTSLFNAISGSHRRVGNYSGVTVDVKTSSLRYKDYTINISDLPGTYSLTEYSPEELYVRHHIVEQMPDVVINVVDATNLERNLYLTTGLIDMDLKVVMALNMYDELLKSNISFDYKALGSMIGIPIIPTSAREGKGTYDLLDKIIDVFNNNEPTVRHVHISYGSDIENAIHHLQKEIRPLKDLMAHYSARYVSVKMLEGDKDIVSVLKPFDNFPKIEHIAQNTAHRIEESFGESVSDTIADAKYGFIAGALSETLTKKDEHSGQKRKDLDAFITNKWLGFPIFMAIMLAMFQATFTLGAYPADWIGNGVEALSSFLGNTLPDSGVKDLLLNGIINGVGGVIVFLPNILILFFFISLMEDTGYMARAAFIMDRMMHKIGLHGKSFIPILMGFGCNVPAIMATRTLESRKDRILTMLIIPFTSCSARLPVYVLLIGAFFPNKSGLVLFSVYIIGIIVAVLTSLALKRIFFNKTEAPFVMELPPYRVPTFYSVARHMWDKGMQYLKKMGTIILLASVVIWAAGNYPVNVEYSRDFDQEKETVIAQNDISQEKKDSLVAHLDALQSAEHQEKSYIGQVGHALEPIISPLGFNWQIGVSLLTGFAAKEIVVSTMAVLAQGDEDNLGERLKTQKYTSGEKEGELVYSPLTAFTLMVFILLYFPCIATIAAIGREAGWRWAVFTALYTTSMAYFVAWIVYNIGTLLL
ncbi:MAG: ferrous iron transport protein B [Flavobacteriales bacterium]|nr:ferrous iron transport protein B [Flavobacteriales bacterium]